MSKPARKADKSLIPERFMLGGTIWTVRLVPGLSELGNCNRDEALITLNADSPPQIIASTFAHELVHAIKFTQGLTEHDEREVDAFGNLLHQFFVTRD